LRLIAKKADNVYQLPTTAHVISLRREFKWSVQLRSSLQLLQVQPVV